MEQIGATLLALDERMAELREHFGLTPADLNIDLGRSARCCRPMIMVDRRGPTPGPEYDVRALAAHLTQEIVLHGWDLAAATEQTARFPDEVAATVLRWLDREHDAERDDGW